MRPRRSRSSRTSGPRSPQRLEDAEAHSARIAAELSAAETTSREAEAALAELLARQAAMRAERRVAEAALEAAQAQLGRTEQEQAEARRASCGARRRTASRCARVTKPKRERRRRARRWPKPKPGGVEAEQGRAQLPKRATRPKAGSPRRAPRCRRRSSEHDALARALEHGGGAAIASLRAEPGYERALAAALGEDADAAIGGDGPRRWQGSEALAGRSRASRRNATASPTMSSAPRELLRRLRQVAVADEDKGQPLAVGQRLVTRDGRLRRWDGFVAVGDGRSGGRAAASRQSSRRARRRIAGARKCRRARRPAERDRALADDGAIAGRLPRKRALPRWPPSATRAKRPGRSTLRPRRSSGSRRSARALTQRQADLEPVLGAATRSRGRRRALARRPARSRGARA